MTVYISVIFSDQQEKDVREAMRKNDVTWSDLVKIDNPDYYNWPYQVRLIFDPHHVRGDDNYADWRAGDTFIDTDDPNAVEFRAIEVVHDQKCVTYQHLPEGEVLATFDTLRRVKRGKR